MDRVLLIGSSLAISSIGAALATVKDLELLPVESPGNDIAASITAFAPDAVIFDLAAGVQHALLTTLSTRPGLTLIGFDLCAHKMLLLSAKNAALSTTEDLVRAVKEIAQDGSPIEGQRAV